MLLLGYKDATYEYSQHPKTFLLLKLPLYFPPHVQSHSLRAPPWPSPPACCWLVYLAITI